MRRTYVYQDGAVIPKEQARPVPRRGRSHQIMGDLKESFVSPVDGSVIGSKADRREHNKRNGVIDVGNDPAALRPKPPYEPHGLAEDIVRAMEEPRSLREKD